MERRVVVEKTRGGTEVYNNEGMVAYEWFSTLCFDVCLWDKKLHELIVGIEQ